MKLSSVTVLELNKKYNLIEGLSERELNNPEGIDMELRVGRVERIVGDSFLAADNTSRERYSPITEVIGEIEDDGNKIITMKPGDYLLVGTIEKINCPAEKIIYDVNEPARYLIPDIRPRVTLQKGGVSLHCSTTNPGYSGRLVFGIKNNEKYDFKFELGARMFKIYWEAVSGEIKRAYTGQHQGGRFTSQGEKEVQN